MDIELAYDIAKEAHRRFARDEGTRYFEHLRSVALILMDECHITEPDIVISALLHDSIEDTPIMGNILLNENVWRKTARYRLKKIFDYRVADTVIALTKPRINGTKTTQKEHIQKKKYSAQILTAPPEAGIIKMADRLHNLRTLSGTKKEKQRRQIKETREFLLPIFEKKTFGIYTRHADTLRKKIMQETEKMEKKISA
jgi:(p)ppGpp synthase/HD superfamily hydrolase